NSIQPPTAQPHPSYDDTPSLQQRSIDRTAATLSPDERAYVKVFLPLVRNAGKLIREILAPPAHVPHHPWALARFGINAIRSAETFNLRHFSGNRARSLFAGIAGHASMPLHLRPTAAFGLLLGMLGHSNGWPIVRGGSQKLSDALASYLKSLGGRTVTGTRISSLGDLPTARAILLDITPKQLLKLASDRFPPSYRWELQ